MGEQIVKTLVQSKDEYEAMYLRTGKLASPTGCQEHQESRAPSRWPRTILREIQPRRLVDRLLRPIAGAAQLQMANQKDFDLVTYGQGRPAQGAITACVAALGHAGIRHPAPNRFTHELPREDAAARRAASQRSSARRRRPTRTVKVISAGGRVLLARPPR